MLGSVDTTVAPPRPRLAPKLPRFPRFPDLLAWRPTTPTLLRLAMVLLAVPLALVGVAIRVAVERNDRAIETVGADATRGITVAQEIKTDLAELDARAVTALLPSTSTGEAEVRYARQRRTLEDGLTRAAREMPRGAAYRQALVDLDYALGHYHALVGDSLAAQAAGDQAGALASYARAHQVMAGTLLPAADFVDKANTYLLNTTYSRHADEAANSGRWVRAAGTAAFGALVVAQLLLTLKFRRALNPALVAATILVLALCTAAVQHLDDSARELSTGTGGSFESVHALARARAVAVTARQAEAQWLLQPSGSTSAAIDDAVARLFRSREVKGSGDLPRVVRQAAADVPVQTGGLLATAGVMATVPDEDGAVRAADPSLDRALIAFADYVEADQVLRAPGPFDALTRFRDDRVFTRLTHEIDTAQAVEQHEFDRHAQAAADATDPERRLVLVGTAGAILLAGGGLYRRLREYRS